MTLYRQLFTWMLAIFFLLIMTITGIELNNTRHFLLTQQSSEVNNTINSMGLALAPYLESNDKVAIESVINALFDKDFYQEIRLKILSDDSEILRQYPVTVEGVPDWFINLNLFPVLSEERTFSSGWLQLAEIQVVTCPRYAYKEMWRSTIQLGIWFSVLFIIAILTIGILLNRYLRPLALITVRAKQISNNKFSEPLPLPPTTELRIIVNAINQMSQQLEDYFDQQVHEADKLRGHAYRDVVSGLGNRSFFIGQLKSWLAESAVGGLMMVKVELISDTYNKEGVEQGDTLVSQFAQKLSATISNTDYTASRISKDEFVILAPNCSNEDLMVIGESLLAIVTNMQPDPMNINLPQVAIGLVINNTDNRDPSILLAQADNALTQARNEPTHPIAVIDQTAANDSTMGKQQWKSLILDAIAHECFVFKFQSASTSDQQVIHQEVFSAIERNGNYYSAAHFLGAVEQLGLGGDFDRYVVNYMIKQLNADETLGPIAINLTKSSVTDPSFIRWVNAMMEKHRNLAGRLFFEIPESVFVRYPDHVSLLTEHAHRFNFGFGIDNYGRNFQSLDYLNKFKPSYVKIDFAYTSNLDDEAQSHVLASICRTAHNLNITTIATRVETETQLNKLSELFVNGFQGFIFEKSRT